MGYIAANTACGLGYFSIIGGGQQHFFGGVEQLIHKGGPDTDDGFAHAANVMAE